MSKEIFNETNNKTNTESENAFKTAFKGKFLGILKWHHLDDLWVKVKDTSEEGWFIYAVGEEPPSKITQGLDVDVFIDKLDVLLRREHDEAYCGIVYANDLTNPSFIKVFDPNNIGTSCSVGQDAPLPGWIISKIPPIDLPEAMKPTANRRRWWQKVFK